MNATAMRRGAMPQRLKVDVDVFPRMSKAFQWVETGGGEKEGWLVGKRQAPPATRKSDVRIESSTPSYEETIRLTSEW